MFGLKHHPFCIKVYKELKEQKPKEAQGI